MPATLQLTISMLRESLDDLTGTYNTSGVSGNYYTNQELTDWINDACYDIAARAECLWGSDAVTTTSNVSTYTLPGDLIRINRVTFVPGPALSPPIQTYPLQYRMLNDMDEVWGINQITPSTYPIFYTLWGTPPSLSIQIFPVPASSGTLNFFYYRVPVSASAMTDTLDIPQGYDYVVRLYAEYMAMRKSGNPAWQDAKGLYEQGIADLISRTRSWTDQAGTFTTGGSWLPTWLTGSGDF